MTATGETMRSVLVDTSEGIATLTLNRPQKLNAISYRMIDELMAHLDDLEVNDSVQAVILTGAGERAFSAGADIPGFIGSIEAGVDVALRDFVRRGQSLTKRIETFPKPIIAAVNGIAFGGGCEIVEACPLATASSSARFAKPEIKLGFPPPFGGTQRLPRLVGRKRALRMILTGEPISADQAADIGLVNEVVSPDRLMPQVRVLAMQIARQSPAAVPACLESVTRGLNLTIDEGLGVEASQFARMVPTGDIREGVRAFLERRSPQFHGAQV